jgi:hypothetical protein
MLKRVSNGIGFLVVSLAVASEPGLAQTRKPSIGKVDPFPAKSVWIDESSGLTLTVIERKGNTFRARLVVGEEVDRTLVGTVRDGKISWLAKEVKSAKGGQGGDNTGTIRGDQIEFEYRSDAGSGTFTVRRSDARPEKPNPQRAGGGKIASKASAYLDQALDIMQKHSMRRDKIDWASLRAQTREKAIGARAPSQTYDAIRFALQQLGDGHSFFMSPLERSRVMPDWTRFPSEAEYTGSFNQVPAADKNGAKRQAPDPSGRMIDGRWAYMLVPRCHIHTGETSFDKYIGRLLAVVRELDSKKPDGWIIDLRGNEGGAIWPMLVGVGPILGEGELGSFVYPNGVNTKWHYRAGQTLLGKQVVAAAPEAYSLIRANPPTAVLTDERTGSAGEAVAIAFRGRPRTRSFGRPTFGVSTANQGFRLSDGAILVLAVATMVDRSGKAYGGAVEPDEVIPVDENDDTVLKVAVTWLGKQVKSP